MTTPAILAIDQGTTNTKAFLISTSGQVLGKASRSMTVTYPKPGWAELDAAEIWQTVRDTINEVLAAVPEAQVQSIGITNQRESIILWSATTGKPLAPCVIWQCRRSADLCNQLRERSYEPFITETSGLGLDPLFPAGKIAWLLDQQPALRDHIDDVRAGTVDSWLLWNLTGGNVHATDASNASRTQLMNLRDQQWDSHLASLFNVPLSILPRILPSDAKFGTTFAGTTDLPAGVPINAIMGDSHSALHGHGIRQPGQVKVTLGTGSSLMAITPAPVRSTHGLSSTIAWKNGGHPVYALEGNISVSGQTAAFTADLLNLRDETELTELARTVPDAGGVVFVPALAGLGAPHWNDAARGQISGMTLGTQPAHIARAALNAIALQILDVITAMELDLGARLPEVLVDGGASSNDFLMQLLADILDRRVRRPTNPDVTAFGVAQMAGTAVGIWMSHSQHGNENIFLPGHQQADRDEIIASWAKAVKNL